jgi:hypothetical protein
LQISIAALSANAVASWSSAKFVGASTRKYVVSMGMHQWYAPQATFASVGSSPYTPSGTGRVTLPGDPAIDFCAGEMQADSLFGGMQRQVWERVPAG